MTSDTLDACLRLVADHHRRRIVHHLRHQTDDIATFHDLVGQLYRIEIEANGDDGLGRERLALLLRDTHLPKLADHGVVEFDLRTGAVRYQPDEQVERLLDALPADEPMIPR